jgi:hypothetical protein
MNDGVASLTSHRIRVLNDNFRWTFIGGKIVMTERVAALTMDIVARALVRVQTFTDFTVDNDPHGEHDFGSFEIDHQTFFWKIDYYSKDFRAGSEDPTDPARTARVLTIMLAEEY